MASRLERYREMRDFSRTPEPRGKKATSRRKELHFYVQRRERVKITHPERLIWARERITKLDLVRYVEEVGEWLLPEIAGRPLTVVRCPDGADGKCFYQRHLHGKKEYIVLESLEEIVRLVQNGAVELHTWGAARPDLKHPDRITLDLDPGPDLSWEKLVQAAELTRKLVESLGFEGFLKTTGGKGLHVVFPIARKNGWDEVKDFARSIAEFLVKAEPKLFIANMAKKARTGKVFVDYLRNGETASAVAAYSPRARPGATVSTPVAWQELDEGDLRGRFTIRNVPERLAKLKRDPWAGYEKARRPITAAMKKALAG